MFSCVESVAHSSSRDAAPSASGVTCADEKKGSTLFSKKQHVKSTSHRDRRRVPCPFNTRRLFPRGVASLLSHRVRTPDSVLHRVHATRGMRLQRSHRRNVCTRTEGTPRVFQGLGCPVRGAVGFSTHRKSVRSLGRDGKPSVVVCGAVHALVNRCTEPYIRCFTDEPRKRADSSAHSCVLVRRTRPRGGWDTLFPLFPRPHVRLPHALVSRIVLVLEHQRATHPHAAKKRKVFHVHAEGVCVCVCLASWRGGWCGAREGCSLSFWGNRCRVCVDLLLLLPKKPSKQDPHRT